MHGLRKLWASGLLTICWAFASAQAQTTIPGYEPGKNYVPPTPEWRGQAGMTFLQVGGSARGEGMAGAFIAAKGDPSIAFYNPAGLANIPRFAAYANQTAWIADMTLNHLVVAFNPGPFVVGATVLHMDYGVIEGTVKADNPLGYDRIGNLTPSAYAVGLVYAMQLIDRFSFGVHAKYVRQNLGAFDWWTFYPAWHGEPPLTPPMYVRDPPTTGDVVTLDHSLGLFAVDLGTQYVTGFRNVAVNMSLRHFGAPQTYVDDAAKFDLPLTYQAGLSSEVIQLVTGLESPTHKVYLAIDGVDQRDVTLDVSFGVEYIANLSDVLPGMGAALRFGRRAARNQQGQFSFGAGMAFALDGFSARLDYAYSDFGPQLTANRLGLTLMMK